jgi:AraC family ethanolamine operon transcriptional activator
MKFPAVMTIDELALYLRLPKTSLYPLLEEGRLPGRKVANRWRFHRAAVDLWLSAHSEDPSKAQSPDQTETFFMSAESHDIAEHADLVGKFDVRMDQLSQGEFHGKVKIIKTPGMLIFEESYLRKSVVQGSTPEEYILLGTNIAPHRSDLRGCGTDIDQKRFACSGPGAAIDFVMPDESHDICMLIKPEILAPAISQQAFELLSGSQTVDFSATAGQGLITALTAVMRGVAKNPAQLNNPYAVKTLESRLLEKLSHCIEGSSLAIHTQPLSKRTSHVRKAIEFAEQSFGPVTTVEMAMAAGISIRSLEYAFLNVLGISPYQYLRFHRLNAAHRELNTADPNKSSVTAIALKWGFSHAGRFSVLHRQFFDEKPSETLRRA